MVIDRPIALAIPTVTPPARLSYFASTSRSNTYVRHADHGGSGSVSAVQVAGGAGERGHRGDIRVGGVGGVVVHADGEQQVARVANLKSREVLVHVAGVVAVLVVPRFAAHPRVMGVQGEELVLAQERQRREDGGVAGDRHVGVKRKLRRHRLRLRDLGRGHAISLPLRERLGQAEAPCASEGRHDGRHHGGSERPAAGTSRRGRRALAADEGKQQRDHRDASDHPRRVS
jgi:hypothetical protein